MPEVLGEESAKTIGKVVDFCSRCFGGTIEQYMGLWEDKLRYRRFENQLALMQKAEVKMKESGIAFENCRALGMKTGIPLMEAASLEDDPDIQEIWARLLVNAMDPQRREIRRAFIAILEQLEKKDILVLNEIYSYRQELMEGLRESEPSSPESLQQEHSGEDILEEERAWRDRTITQSILNKRLERYQVHGIQFNKEETLIACWNLIRLGCLNQVSTWGGLTIARVEYTPLGAALFEACS